jgi:hypothetical protein
MAAYRYGRDPCNYFRVDAEEIKQLTENHHKQPLKLDSDEVVEG